MTRNTGIEVRPAILCAALGGRLGPDLTLRLRVPSRDADPEALFLRITREKRPDPFAPADGAFPLAYSPYFCLTFALPGASASFMPRKSRRRP